MNHMSGHLIVNHIDILGLGVWGLGFLGKYFAIYNWLCPRIHHHTLWCNLNSIALAQLTTKMPVSFTIRTTLDLMLRRK